MASGLAGAVAAGERRNYAVPVLSAATVAALLALAGAAAACVMQFGRPAMIFAAFGNTESALFRELTSWGLMVFVLLGYLVAAHRGAYERTCRLWAGAAALAGLLFALSVASTCMMPWRAAWNTWTILLPGVGYAFLTAILAFQALSLVVGENFPGLKTVSLAGAVVTLALMALYLTVIGFDGTSEPSASRVLSGDLLLPFWLGAVLVGVLLPAFLAWVGSKNPALLLLGVVSTFVGSGIFYWVIRQLGSSTSWSLFRQLG